MRNLLGRNYWIIFLIAVSVAGASGRSGENQVSSRNLNPYHEQQLRDQIEKCASGVLACTDTEKRCLKQQELCQLLIRAERYDEALQVAHNIYRTDQSNKERCAAHHFLLAEIYNRKMKASRTLEEMEKNRQFALSAAQEVVEQKYPSKWGVSEHSRALIRQLNDSSSMGIVRQRVASREGTGDPAKEAIADAQRKYLDATQGGGQRNAITRPSTGMFQRVMPEEKPDRAIGNLHLRESNNKRGQNQAENLPSSPEVRRVVSPPHFESGAAYNVSERLNRSGLLTSQPNASISNGDSRQSILVNGAAATKSDASVDSVVQNNLAQLLESARKRKENSRSPYATGELPASR